MKYRTFRKLAVVTGLAVVAGLGLGVKALVGRDDAATPRAVPAAAPVAALAPAAPPAVAEPAPVDGLRAVDRDALALLRRPVAEKVKDATRGRPYKINAYSDDGKRWNRLKIDLDRDEQWDESWSIKPGGRIERKLSRRDETGARAYRLVDERAWQPMP
jgi:hypothetical protein